MGLNVIFLAYNYFKKFFYKLFLWGLTGLIHHTMMGTLSYHIIYTGDDNVKDDHKIDIVSTLIINLDIL